MLPHPLPVDFLISVTEATMKAHPELCDTGYKKMDRVSSPEKPAVITVVLLSVWCVPSPVLCWALGTAGQRPPSSSCRLPRPVGRRRSIGAGEGAGAGVRVCREGWPVPLPGPEGWVFRILETW